MKEWKAAATAKSKAELSALESQQERSGDWRSKAEEKLTIEFREAVQARIIAEAQASAEVGAGATQLWVLVCLRSSDTR